jgi:hypothetical protein
VNRVEGTGYDYNGKTICAKCYTDMKILTFLRYISVLSVLVDPSESGSPLDYGEFFPDFYEQYQRVSFAEIEANPGKYTGTVICIEGYLGINYRYSDTLGYTALFEAPFDPADPSSLGTHTKMLSLDPVYLKPLQILRKRWTGRKVRLYGFYFVPARFLNQVALCSIVRIDRVVLAPRPNK